MPKNQVWNGKPFPIKGFLSASVSLGRWLINVIVRFSGFKVQINLLILPWVTYGK